MDEGEKKNIMTRVFLNGYKGNKIITGVDVDELAELGHANADALYKTGALFQLDVANAKHHTEMAHNYLNKIKAGNMSSDVAKTFNNSLDVLQGAYKGMLVAVEKYPLMKEENQAGFYTFIQNTKETIWELGLDSELAKAKHNDEVVSDRHRWAL